MTVTAAAELLNIGRPALSRVLNGKAALSPRLAERIQQAFGFPAEKLLKMQASYNAGISKNSGASSPVGSYVPPFLQIRARQIEEWASGIQARSRLSVLLRILVNSTGIGLEKVDFPGNDDAERQGWDGVVEAERTTPWIPQGLSGWEFGCNKGIKSKADKDFGKRTRSVPESERRAATFVFVTPRRWTEKNDWEETRREERQWKDVRAFDASDLEQWVEQSIPAQIWFAHETGIPSKGVFSLEQCWKHWQADCEPALVPSLFNQALRESKDYVMRWLGSAPGTPLKIAADSTAEALAYLHVAFSKEEPLFQKNRDKVAVFKESGILPDLLSAESSLIVVSTSSETERELAPYRKSLKAILVYSQNMANVNPDITLKPLNYFALDNSLKEMRLNQDDVDRYRRECGYSLTVLRRRLSRLPKVRTPQWADTEHAEKLIPMIFAGAWNSNNETDNFLVSELADGMDVESEILRLSQLEDSPVWSFDAYRGVKSKIDALFAVSESVTASHIEKFLQVAEIVLSEDDPALDLPEDQQWLADLYGKRREISDLLRAGVISSFVLLAVHGNSLFRDRIEFDIEIRIKEMIKELLSPLTERVLEAQSDALPVYAEAAPDTFLSIVEQDIESGTQEVMKLFGPVDASLFKSPSWVELLWALESLAWYGEHLVRTVDILARLARVESDDSYLNKAINSLAAIFWPAAPQTSVPISELTRVFNHLLEKFPDIGWILCMKQLEQGSSISPTHKQKWRTDGHGHGQPVSEYDYRKFVRNAARKAIDWNPHTEETLADLIQSLGPHSKIPFEWRPEVWKLIENWHEDRETSDADRAWLREIMRVSVDFKASPEAERAYNMLEPSDCVLKYEWLFHSHAVVYSKTELVNSDLDIHKYGAKIELQRISALSEIYSEHGLSGLIRLAGLGEAQHVIGNLVLRVDSFSGDEAKSLMHNALDKMTEENRTQMATLIRSLLMGLEPASLDRILEKFSEASSEETFLKILLLAPFNPGTWRLANKLDKEKWYWKEVEVQQVTDPVQLNEAVERLMEAERPLSATSLAQYQIHKIETGRIFRLLESIVKGVNKSRESRRLDPMFIEKAFAQLDKRTDLPRNKIADMEVVYIDFLKHSKRGIPCVEDRIKQYPEFFAEIVFTAYNLKKDSSIQDDILKKKIWGSLDLLDSLKRLPGRDESGELKPENLVKWIRDAQAIFRRSNQLATGDYCIGELLSKSPDGKDGIWPCEPVRDTLEKVYSEKISNGFQIGRSNSHDGTHAGFGGDPERKTERRYREWAERIKYSHPKTSRILRELADNSSAMADYQDRKAEKLFRQMSF